MLCDNRLVIKELIVENGGMLAEWRFSKYISMRTLRGALLQSPHMSGQSSPR